ncbi:hypothetical protein [Allorhodopirellula solitaria]|uniref:Zinc finger/thioredoxin putative domain-containing protein n=1 Tax=Allorhodopirellula solitaria TaxID=2527987 RepID=A0A5C5X989_9BACT|nr:hypothetical protein [Allorhodopirellula solitaria]TWT59279.1 hypothetical protein CA85_39750 [Allorhodopirellula solitaria]
MSIQVTCPHCFKRFQVSDKFAGKSGPCPACKKSIKVPELTEQVVVHAPEDESPKDSKGRSVLKPITAEDPVLTNRMLFMAAAGVVALFAVALAFRLTGGTPLWGQLLGVVLLAPLLVRIGYTFVHDRELAPYTGVELRNRVLVCSALLVATWIVYAFVPAYVLDLESASEMSWTMAGITFCVMLVLGAFASVACFELEFPNGLAHAGFYYSVVIILALVAGVTLAGKTPVGRRALPDAGPAAGAPAERAAEPVAR